MNDDSVLGGIGSQLGNLGKQIGLSTIGAPVDVAKTAAGQIGINVPTEEEKDAGLAEGGESPKTSEQKAADDTLAKQKAEEFKKLMYSPSSFDKDSSDPTVIAQLAKQGNVKTPEEQAKIQNLQAQLASQHKAVYFDPTFNRPEVPEERVQEKEEREEEEQKMAALEFQKKEEKDQNISVIMASNKTEQFRGASG